jgi:exonuclease SbcC
MQGDSAGICEATPAERKAVLYQILEDRLSKFGPLHESAKSTVKIIDDATIAARTKQTELLRRVALKADEETARTMTAKKLEQLNIDLKASEAQANSLRESLARSQSDLEKIESIDKQITSVNAEIIAEFQKLSDQRSIITTSEHLLQEAPELLAQCQRADEIEKELEEISKKRDRYQELQQVYRDKEIDYRDRIRNIESNRNEIGADYEEQKEPLRKEESELRMLISVLNNQLEGARSQSALFEEVPCTGEPVALECKLLAEARNASQSIPGIKTQISLKQERLDEITESISELQQQYQQRVSKFNEDLKTIEIAKDEGLAAIKAKAIAIGFDQGAYIELQNKYNALKALRAKLPELSAAEAKVKAAQQVISDIDKTIRGKRLQILGLEKDMDEAKKLLTGVDDIRLKLQTSETLVFGMRESVDRANRELAIHEERLAEISRAEAELQAISEDLNEQERKRLIYATLQDAFSRDGIPALIIDAAVPAIEEIANDMLSHLSDGRMSMKFITQKNKSTGGIAETLDIIVSDSQGERPYEDWSGGEKLRIDLAVRIGLGRLLAQRTGARIELLILDEVCAPLDQAGEDALIECIDRMRTSFGCILLITHRDSLRDRLPQQIIVSKNGTGSTVEVIA